jgi:hypothetical protein
MLNLNLNIIRAKPLDIGIAPILANTFEYLVLGGGGGGAAGGGSIGGNGGAGGQLVSGSFSFNHLSSANLNVGNGGEGGAGIGLNGTNGTNSTLIYQSSTIATANGGAAGTNSTQNRGGKTSTIDSSALYTWGQDGTKGGDTPSGTNGVGGGTSGQQFPWGESAFLAAQTAFTNSGGGGGGFRWDSFNGTGLLGNGAKGMLMLRFFDPRDVFEYTGDWTVFVYENGYKYFYYQNTGTFTFLGKRD